MTRFWNTFTYIMHIWMMAIVAYVGSQASGFHMPSKWSWPKQITVVSEKESTILSCRAMTVSWTHHISCRDIQTFASTWNRKIVCTCHLTHSYIEFQAASGCHSKRYCFVKECKNDLEKCFHGQHTQCLHRRKTSSTLFSNGMQHLHLSGPW